MPKCAALSSAFDAVRRRLVKYVVDSCTSSRPSNSPGKRIETISSQHLPQSRLFHSQLGLSQIQQACICQVWVFASLPHVRHVLMDAHDDLACISRRSARSEPALVLVQQTQVLTPPPQFFLTELLPGFCSPEEEGTLACSRSSCLGRELICQLFNESSHLSTRSFNI